MLNRQNLEKFSCFKICATGIEQQQNCFSFPFRDGATVSYFVHYTDGWMDGLGERERKKAKCLMLCKRAIVSFRTNKKVTF